MNIQELIDHLTLIAPVSTAPEITSEALGDLAILLRSRATDSIEQFLVRYVMQRIQQILTANGNLDLSTEISIQSANNLLPLFMEIFELIKDTNLSPPHNPYGPLTKLLLALAQYLEDKVDKSRYEILMPTVVITDYEASATSLKDRDLTLTNFVLSDDNTRIIQVWESLKFAEEDGVFKHTSLQGGRLLLLSPTEKQRVIGHSVQASSYELAIRTRLEMRKSSPSFGAMLQILQDDLSAGSANIAADASGSLAGSRANLGIQNFFAWYHALCETDRIKLAQYSIRGSNADQNITLEEIFKRLLDPKFKRDGQQDSIYCVELIANEINLVLRAHPELHQNFPSSVDAAQSSALIENAQQRLIAASDALKIAMQDPNYTVQSSYGLEGLARLFNNVNVFWDSGTCQKQFIFICRLIPGHSAMEFLRAVRAGTYKHDLDRERLQLLVLGFRQKLAEVVAILADDICSLPIAEFEAFDAWFSKTLNIDFVKVLQIIPDKFIQYPTISIFYLSKFMSCEQSSLEVLLAEAVSHPEKLFDVSGMAFFACILAMLKNTEYAGLRRTFFNNIFKFFNDSPIFIRLIQKCTNEELIETFLSQIHIAFLLQGYDSIENDLNLQRLIRFFKLLPESYTIPATYYELGLLLRDGNIVDLKLSEVIKLQYMIELFKVAALQDNAKAQHNIGIAYYKLSIAESGLEYKIKLLNHARAWFTKSAAQGIEESKRNLARLDAIEAQFKAEAAAKRAESQPSRSVAAPAHSSNPVLDLNVTVRHVIFSPNSRLMGAELLTGEAAVTALRNLFARDAASSNGAPGATGTDGSSRPAPSSF